MPAEHVAALRAAGSRRVYRQGDTLIWQGEHEDFVLLIEHGHVWVTSTSPGGHTSVLAVRGPGEVVGELAGVDHGPRSATVTAVSPVEALMIPAPRFRRLLGTAPGLSLWLLEVIVQRLREADRQRLEYGAYSAVARAALCVLDLAERTGRPVRGQPGAVLVDILQRELAGLVGVSRTTMDRAIRDLAGRGLLRTRRGGLVVTDPGELARLVSDL
ncbi:Crp/Fnr family transcriptional regulator [Longispora albida]|uniref:Crp/Fnr family transcriptional regulator n=1 Tax=Longispora albida TaxID=203523 RepID=UPI00037194D4|nr:Crp/Fnr family transcriptional regulator [Longispora albida]